jgi:capsular polysaccharide biosynthesis protein
MAALGDRPPFTAEDRPGPASGISELPRRMPIVLVVRRHLALVIFPTLVLLAAGIAVGAVRSPTYTAQASLIIGGSDPASPNFGGNISAAGSLATAYSRAIVATPVVDSVSSKLKVSRSIVTGGLSSAPVPDSPAFNVYANASSAHLAIAMANTANTSVLAYVNALNSASRSTQKLLASYEAASSKVSQDNSALAVAGRTPSNTRAITAARATRDRDQLILNTLGSAYSAALQANPPTTGVSVLTTASGATSDRKSTIELLGFVGLVVGALLGVALAMLAGAREVRRVALR